ncbi:MAG: protein-tyrosine-phosphatase [Bacteroidia bacterium]|nr:protein-tyrosine-phosphatase [Bacteroidia bacterium]
MTRTLLLFLLATVLHHLPTHAQLSPDLSGYLKGLEPGLDSLTPERKALLDPIAEHLRAQAATGQPIRLLFVCTHNSRRSQMSQVWAKAIAEHVGFERIETESAGLEATAFNPRAISALARAGFAVKQTPSALPGGDRVTLVYGANDEALKGLHSKTLVELPATWQPFTALMTCSDADEKCPFVPGAAARFKLTFEDPKVADGTPNERQAYDERCRQIATELLYVFTQAHQAN